MAKSKPDAQAGTRNEASAPPGDEGKKPGPVDRFRDGAIEIAIWRNEGPNGPFFTADPKRTYKKDGQWKTGGGYSERDMESLERLAPQVRAKLQALNARHKQTTPEA
jgi:hypothetical protein